MFRLGELLIATTALILLITLPRCAAAQALQEIRIGSSLIGFSSLMSYFARDREFFEREGLDAKIIYVQTNVGLAALTAGNFDYSNLSTSAVEATLRGMPLRLIAVTNAGPCGASSCGKALQIFPNSKAKNLEPALSEARVIRPRYMCLNILA